MRGEDEMADYNILIAEDDADIVELLMLYLLNEGFHVFTAKDGEEAYRIVEKEPIDLAVVDIMMPKMNGYELTKKIREKYSFPILFLTAKNEDCDKILGLNIGADDYLTKPFNPLEVIARINSALRRFYQLNQFLQTDKNEWMVGELKINNNNFTLYKGEEAISLTATEHRILSMLMKSPGRVFTRTQIYENIHGDFFTNDDNTMMVHISKLREKIEADPRNPEYIKTIRGIGYKCEKK